MTMRKIVVVFQLISSEIDGFLFHNNWRKSINKHSLEKIYRSRKIPTLTCLYVPMHLDLDDYPPYSDKRSVIFETHINRNLRCSHGYTNCVRHTDLITWVSKTSWEMLHSEFSHAERISACPGTIIFSNCEQNNMIGIILNAGYNVDDQEDFGFKGSYFKISPTVIEINF